MKKSFELKCQFEENSKQADVTFGMQCSMLDAVIILADALYRVCDATQLNSKGRQELLNLFNRTYALVVAEAAEGKRL